MKLEIKEKVDNLLEKVEKLEVPDAPESWLPFALEGKDFILASREKGNRLEIKSFRREGIWKKIGEYLEKRERLLDEIEKTLRKDPEYDVILF